MGVKGLLLKLNKICVTSFEDDLLTYIVIYRFMNERDFASSVEPRVVEGEPAQPLSVRLRHNLQALNDPLHVLVLQHRIFAWKKNKDSRL